MQCCSVCMYHAQKSHQCVVWCVARVAQHFQWASFFLRPKSSWLTTRRTWLPIQVASTFASSVLGTSIYLSLFLVSFSPSHHFFQPSSRPCTHFHSRHLFIDDDLLLFPFADLYHFFLNSRRFCQLSDVPAQECAQLDSFHKIITIDQYKYVLSGWNVKRLIIFHINMHARISITISQTSREKETHH